MYKTAFFLIAILGLVSCKTTTDRQWVVINDSSTEFVVLFDGEMESYSSQTTILAGEGETIGLERIDGEAPAGNPTDKITDMLIFNATDSADKDFSMESNWAVRQENGSDNSITYVFTFELTDADF